MRVVIADDSGLFRESLARSLVEVGVEVLAQFASTADLLLALDAEPVDVAIVDVYFHGQRDGLDAARVIRQRHPGVAVLLLSAQTVTRQAIELLGEFDHGIGYLQKDNVADVEELRTAIERVKLGECVIDGDIVRRLLQAPSREAGLHALSPQERAVLDLMAQGYSNRGIAKRCFLSERTVEDHIGRIFTKLQIDAQSGATTVDQNRRVLAVLTWLRVVQPG